MKAADAAKLKLNPSAVPRSVQHQLAAVTLTCMRRTQRENPELWAKIEARAAEIREGRAPEYGGK